MERHVTVLPTLHLWPLLMRERSNGRLVSLPHDHAMSRQKGAGAN
jgi:hypothetical protein